MRGPSSGPEPDVGFAVGGGSVAVFVLVPAGMILFGASAGLARGLEEGIRERVKRMIAGKRKCLVRSKNRKHTRHLVRGAVRATGRLYRDGP